MTEPTPHHPETDHGPEHAHSPKKPEGIWQWLSRNVKEKVSKLLGWGGSDHGHAHGHEHGHAHKPNADHDANGTKEDDAKVIERLKKLSTHEVKLEPSVLKGFYLFMEHFKPEIKNVLYPCCGSHVIGDTFPKAHVTYVDLSEACIKAYKKAGLDAHAGSVLDFKPEHDPDLLVLFNPTLKKEQVDKVSETVKPGKYVLCNDYHDTAQHFHTNPDFEFVGVIEHNGGKNVKEEDKNKLFTENLDKYFNEADTDEKLKKFFPKFFEENEKEMKAKEPEGTSVLKYSKKHHKDAFARLFEAGGIDDYYFFRRKNTQTKPARAHNPAA